MAIRLDLCALFAALASSALHADNLKGPVVKAYTPGSNGIDLGPCVNKTGVDIFDFRIWVQPGAAEVAAFNLDASDCDVEPDPHAVGDDPGPPDFDPTDNVDDRNVKLERDGTNTQVDYIDKDMVSNNPFHVIVDFTQPATDGGTVTITPTDTDCHDIVSKDSVGNVTQEKYDVVLGGGGKMMTTEVTYVGLSPVHEISLAVYGGMAIMRADVERAEPPVIGDGNYCTNPGGCWNDTPSYPDFDPQSPIPAVGVNSVKLVPVTPGNVITTGTRFRIQWQLVAPVNAASAIATITIGPPPLAPNVPTLQTWQLLLLVGLAVLGGAVFIARRRAAKQAL